MKTSATLNIELNIYCPHCVGYIDLMTHESGRLNEEGSIVRRAVPAKDWGEEHKSFEEDITCPHCSEEIEVRGIEW